MTVVDVVEVCVTELDVAELEIVVEVVSEVVLVVVSEVVVLEVTLVVVSVAVIVVLVTESVEVLVAVVLVDVCVEVPVGIGDSTSMQFRPSLELVASDFVTNVSSTLLLVSSQSIVAIST